MTFQVSLSGASAGVTVTRSTATVTILDNDAIDLSVAVATSPVTEGVATKVTFTVTMTGSSTSAVQVSYSTVDQSATAPTDYTATSGMLVWNPSETGAKSVDVVLIDNSIYEPTETFSFVLSSPLGADTMNVPSASVTIVDNDPTGFNLPATASVAEGTASVTVAVTLPTPAQGSLSVSYATSSGAATSGLDFASTSGTLVFAPGVTTMSVTIPITDDNICELAESFTLVLSSPIGAPITADTTTVTITDNDACTVSVAAVSVAEDVASSSVTVTASLNLASSTVVTVNFATAGATATSGSDFQPSSGVFTFAPGTTTATALIAIIDDAIVEGSETFNVVLSGAIGAAVTGAPFVVTILDNDVSVVSVAPSSTIEGNSGTTPLLFTISLSAISVSPIKVTYSTSAGTATAGTDYVSVAPTVVTFAPGENLKTLSVDVNGDNSLELDETFSVVLSAPCPQ